ncbi:MAG: YjfB family protein [Bacillota bacterium]|nr:YjfB family protein [Bacillota bacterium]
MDTSYIGSEMPGGLHEVVQMSLQRKTMDLNKSSAATLIEGMENANAKVMEKSVTPFKGSNIDVRL